VAPPLLLVPALWEEDCLAVPKGERERKEEGETRIKKGTDKYI
jgi:hypothetical protein